MYLDDSGSVANKNEENFVLAGVIMHESKLLYINRALDDLAKSISPDSQDIIEFHASEIYARRNGIWRDKNKEEAISIIKKVLNVIPQEANSSNNKICVIGCIIEKKYFISHDPVQLAFENLCSRFDIFLGKRNREKTSRKGTGSKETGLIIFDKSSRETSLQKLAINFRHVGTRWNVTKYLHEVPLFVDSKASRGIQLADHVAYSIFRRYEHGDLNYFNIIQGFFDSDSERIHGLVHKTHDQFCTCPGCLARKMSSSD
nr:MAG TPA: Protein of unknown function (DUF3800) [Caudoviricetes sp.]